MATGPPWPPGQLTDGELARRRQELTERITLLPPSSARVPALRAELDQVEAEWQAPYRRSHRGEQGQQSAADQEITP
jgi:Tfp pilus assembly protein PilN